MRFVCAHASTCITRVITDYNPTCQQLFGFSSDRLFLAWTGDSRSRRNQCVAKSVHWGDWVERRAQRVGYKRKKDLAAAVGCSDDQLTHWLQMAKPPARMRKGFDRLLANALQTTPRTLFTDYLNVAPESAAFTFSVRFVPDAIVVDDAEIFPTDILLREVIARLSPTEKDTVCEYAITLVLSKQDERSAEFQRYRRQLNAEEDMPEIAEPPSFPNLRVVEAQKAKTKKDRGNGTTR